MRASLRATAIAACWVVGVSGAALFVDRGQQLERRALEGAFEERASTSAASVSAYVEDVFDRESRMADSLPDRRVSDADLSEARLSAGFTTSVLLDGRGRVLASSPSGPTLHGGQRTAKYPHIAAALSGDVMVSAVVSSAVGPIVEFALPIDGGVLSSGFVIGSSPLITFVALPSLPGATGYVLDDSDAPVVSAGDGTAELLTALRSGPERSDSTAAGDRLVVSSSIAMTPWRLVLTAPRAAVVAPATANDWVEWLVLGLLSMATAGALLVLRSVSASRQRVMAAQSESEQRFRLTVDNAPIGMLLFSVDGRVLRANDRFCRMLGYGADDVLQLTVSDITHVDDRAGDEAALQQLLSGSKSHFERETRYNRSDRETVWVRVSISLVRDGRGHPLHFVGQSDDITEARAAQQLLEQRALYDSLTGLANRSLLVDRLTHALAEHRRGDETLAVAFCDLDLFKRVNDSLGHHAGDLVLQEVARRLHAILRDGDTVARFGGDEFVILLPRIASLEMATSVLDRAKHVVEQPIEIDGHRVRMSLSAGLAVSGPDISAEMLLRNADRALYAAKEGGRARWTVFTAAMRSTALAELSLEEELRQAIEQDQFELHYQPIVALADLSTVGFEALLRWRHPTRGLLLPADFLDVAQASHLMIDVGQLVLRRACQFLARHPDATWRVFVNVSPAQLGRDLGGVVRAELAAANIPAIRLGIEITESGILHAEGSSLAEMHELRAMGIELLIDDFGTGYSALSSVLTTPITGIKLDQSFTARLGHDDAADRITRTVASLVKDLSAHGVIEGIETEDQHIRALNHGWVYGQGYLFARPAPEHALLLPAHDATLGMAVGYQELST